MVRNGVKPRTSGTLAPTFWDGAASPNCACTFPPMSASPFWKRHREAAEAAFLAKASGLGFGVAKPWGDSERYDFILDCGHGFWRVQVKSTERCAESRYRVKAARDGRPPTLATRLISWSPGLFSKTCGTSCPSRPSHRARD